MQRKPIDELCELARCGGSITIYADTRSADELIELASALRHGAKLTLNGTAMRPNEELCRIAKASPGNVTFTG